MATIEVVGTAEAADLLGMGRSNFNMHRKRLTGPEGCPAPTAELRCGPVWAGSDLTALKRWAVKYNKQQEGKKAAAEKAQAARDAKAATKEAAKPAAPAKKAPAAKKAAPAAKPAASKAPAKKVAPAPVKKGLLKKSAA